MKSPKMQPRGSKPPKAQPDALYREPLRTRVVEWLFAWIVENSKTGIGLIKMGCVFTFLAFFFMYLTMFVLALWLFFVTMMFDGLLDSPHRGAVPIETSLNRGGDLPRPLSLGFLPIEDSHS